MSHWQRPFLAAGLLLAMTAGAWAQDVITKITGDELAEVLKEEGYQPTVEKPTVVSVKMESLKVLFFVAEDGESIQSFAGFKCENASLSKVNEWNKAHRYSRAYIDDEADPVIELDLDLCGGVTKARIVDFIKTTKVSVVGFGKHLFGDN